MSPRTLTNPRHAIDTCTIQFHTWKPFHPFSKTLEKPEPNPIPISISQSKSNKRPCISSIDTLDMSKLSLFEDEGSQSVKSKAAHWMAKKRRRRGGGSRSVSGRSCSIGASNGYGNGTCSDFVMTNNAGFGTDSSGELFVNCDVNWCNDVSELNVRNLNNLNLNSSGVHCYNNNGGSSGSSNHHGNVDSLGNESGYGSEPGYRGDAEFGYGDEIDEEEDDTKVLFWGNRFGDARNMEIIGENTLQKAHHRCRRKKHELRMVVDAV